VTTPESARPSVYAPGRATRTRILEHASTLMWERGVHATTLDDVREASGTSKSQLYKHFGSKTDLVRDVVRVHSETTLARQEALLADVRTIADLERWADGIIRSKDVKHGAYGCVIASLANELADEDDESRRALDATFTGWGRLLTSALARIRDGGGLRADADVDHLAAGLLAALEGGYVLARTAHDVAPLRAALGFALDHLRSFVPRS
jgi:TetR/AcrR family transcriptional regulator, transcriptional repressor for nem operon